jgi:NADH:ubiquinone oxidoreductase subunit 5 (subunit L)/multisubunit Na+/H+ antiporter MnhA subunit
MEVLTEAAQPRWVWLVGLGSGFLGLIVGGSLYMGSLSTVEMLARAFAPIHRILKNKYYVDEIYWAVFVRPTGKLARALAWFDLNVLDRIFVDGFGWIASLWSRSQSWFDDHVVDGLVDGSGWSAETLGAMARRMQNGFVQNYLLVITMALVALLMAMGTFVGKH